jgi:hypothetical protein
MDRARDSQRKTIVQTHPEIESTRAVVRHDCTGTTIRIKDDDAATTRRQERTVESKCENFVSVTFGLDADNEVKG